MSTASVFPGQGSQSIGMLSSLAGTIPVVRDTFAEASEVLGYDLWALCQEGPESDLNSTDRTQPAMLVAGVAVWRAWQQAGGPAPRIAAGHSLGEYTALVCAGALDFEAAVRLVEYRGRLMQEAVPVGIGAMAAVIGLDDAEVEAACEESMGDEVVEAVNYNSPGQVVIAGHTDAVERTIEAAKARGARRAVLLPVSVPAHCSLMKPAAERMAKRLADTPIRRPQVPVIQNVSAAVVDEPERIRDNLAQQLHSPVRWSASMRVAADVGVTLVLEFGPGKVLSGLSKRIDERLAGRPVHDPATLDAALGEARGMSG